MNLLRLFNKNIETDIYVACLPPPEKYYKFSLMFSLISSIVIPLPLYFLFNTNIVLLIPLSFITMLAFSSYFPKILARFRASDIDIELPFFLIYMSTLSIVMTPLQVLEEVSKAPKFVFNQIRFEARRFCIEVRVYGKDPLVALSEVAKTTPHKGLRSILEGYVTAVKSGSNPVDYLIKQSELFIKRRIAEIRAKVENLVSLMESFVSVAIFTVVTLFSLSVSSEALPVLAGQMLTTLRVPKTLIVFSYVLPLLLAMMFMLLAKSMQARSPIGEYRQYAPIILIHIVTITPAAYLILMAPYLLPKSWITIPTVITITLLITSSLSTIIDMKYERFYSSIRRGLRNFVKELRELRRVGVSPEKAIDALSQRDYGKFSKYVRLLNEYIMHYRSLKEYVAEFVKDVRDWLAIALMFTFVDTLEAGGVTVEVLDRYSSYVDSIYLIETERKARLKILRLMPFVTAMIQFLTIYAVLYIFDTIIVGLGKGSLIENIGPMVFSILSITNYIYGLVAGMLSEEKLSSGFKYAAILMGITLFLLVVGEYLVKGIFSLIGGGA